MDEPREPRTDVEVENETHTLNHLHDLAAELSIFKDRKDELARAEKENNKAIGEVQAEMLEIFGTFGMTTFDHDGELFYQNILEKPAIAELKEDDVKQWLRDHGQGGLVQETINTQSFGRFWRNNEQYQEELQTSGLVVVFSKVSISRRKR